MHPIEQQLYEYVEQVGLGNKELPEEVIEEFGKRCGAALKARIAEVKERKFTLRMSNIGKSLRQLMLEKKYGVSQPTPDFLFKMLYGSLYEALTLALLKASDVAITEQDTPVVLPIGDTRILGTLDVVIDGKVYDIKTASPYSYEHKFVSWESLASADSFGYLAQGFGYALAHDKPFGGWIVINKSTGQIKVISLPDEVQTDLQTKYLKEIAGKIDHIDKDLPMPACTEAVEETYYRKPTGNVILGPACKFCSHKDKCHPGIKYAASPNSKGEKQVYKWYIKIKESNDVQV